MVEYILLTIRTYLISEMWNNIDKKILRTMIKEASFQEIELKEKDHRIFTVMFYSKDLFKSYGYKI